MPITASQVSPLLQMHDVRAAVAWYCDKLGFEVVHKHEPDGNLYWVMLRLDKAVIMFNSMHEASEQPAERDEARTIHHADTCLYFATDDVDAVAAHLQTKGVEFKPPFVTFYHMKQLYLHDPEGFELCFQQAANHP